MNESAWRRPVSTDEANRRAAGRRRWNAVRRARAAQRRLLLLQEARRQGIALVDHGAAAKLARLLGVSRSTAARDRDQLLAEMREELRCPLCGQLAQDGGGAQ